MLKAYIDYARFTSSDFFGDLGRVHEWIDFIGQAERSSDALGNIRVRNSGEILPLRESLSGNPPPRREARARVAETLTRGADSGGKGGYAGRRREDDVNLVAHALTSEGHDASEDGTGRGTPMVVSAVTSKWAEGSGGPSGDECQNLVFDTTQISSPGNYSNPKPGDPSHPLAAGAHPPAIFESRYARNGRGAPEEICPPLKAQSGQSGKGDAAPLLAGSGIRRLTPRECERLQGFPDDWTLIDYSGRASKKKIEEDVFRYYLRSGFDEEGARAAARHPDSPRYRAIGNSMAVPVMAWIGRRIQMAEGIE